MEYNLPMALRGSFLGIASIFLLLWSYRDSRQVNQHKIEFRQWVHNRIELKMDDDGLLSLEAL
ncbi:MAG: hypothetical protein PHW04_14965 [Candidatus Wallbacteria bacterium]|nr:hypothetical protein [Candidatus Wallbacteria bacterium]